MSEHLKRIKIDLATGLPLRNLHRSESEFRRMAVVATIIGAGSVVPSTCDLAFKVMDALDKYDREFTRKRGTRR